MTLFESLPSLYKHLITALESMSIKDMTKEYMMVRLMHEISNMKGKELQGDNSTIVLREGKWGNPSWHKNVKTCYYCGKPCHIACFCYKANNKNKKIANNIKEDNDYAFATQQGATHLNTICKWIIDSRATNPRNFR